MNLVTTGIVAAVRNPMESKHQMADHSSGFPVRKNARKGPRTNM